MPRKKLTVKVKRNQHKQAAVLSTIRPTANLKNQAISFWEKLSSNTNENQSRLSMVLGALIILVVGILVFNYFSRQKPALGPSQTTEITQQQDTTPENLPGKYTVKKGDTLFTIAEKYYQDGFKFEELAKTNNLADSNSLEVGQVLNIPKLPSTIVVQESTPQPTSETNPTASPAPTTPAISSPAAQTTSSVVSQDTIWGPAITTDTYTVVEGDWLSKIADRAYGDVFAYNKIAQANNISNPDLIIPGQVLKIPR